MIFLEETIKFDGMAENFPDLESLAIMRGITQVHEDGHNHPYSDTKERE
jgi:hypothetical protein